MANRYGVPGRPYADLDPFEAMLATLLDRALAPVLRSATLSVLRDEGLLEPQALAESDPAELEDALRSAGLKVSRAVLVPMRRLARWIVDLHHGSADELAGNASAATSSEQLRDELLTINGIGPATADSVLLHALGRPIYPLDRATFRILVRHGWADAEAGYDDARDVIERLSGNDAELLFKLVAWFERLGKEFCRASVAKCDKCPLRPYLPASGPIDPNG